jgi:SAM-dependent methyltransferase
MTMDGQDRDDTGAGLEHVRNVFRVLGREDPLYGVLTDHALRGNRWDPEAFFATGLREIQDLMVYLGRSVPGLERGTALDFGCGVGRLSQALAGSFDRVVGVDISDTMVERAREYNRHPDRVRYLVNTAPDLAILGDQRFDLVYSSITLQHIPPRFQARYIQEFMRLLATGGVAVFQVRNGPRIEPGSWRARLYSLRRENLRRWWQRVRGRPPYEMHTIASSLVEELVAGAGGRVLDVVDLSKGRPGRSLRYCATLDLPPPLEPTP